MSAQQHSNSSIEIVDVQALDANNPRESIRKVAIGNSNNSIKCDILIVGGGTGGVAAALAASKVRDDLKICMTEETDWIGGQMTAQGVSALDENKFVETTGACKSYLDLRRSIRKFYSTERKLSDEGASKKYLDPGNSWVTRLAFEPKVCLDLLQDLLKPAESEGKLAVYLRFKPVQVSCETDKDSRKTLKRVLTLNLDNNEIITFEPQIVIDATELGDLLPLSELQYDSGSDAVSKTHESHAPDEGNPENVQDFVYPFVCEFREGESHTIPKPKFYDEFNAKGKFTFEGYQMFKGAKRKNDDGTTSDLLPFWTYRRLIDKAFFNDPNYQHDIAMINWNSNDLRGENIIDQTAETQSDRLARAKFLSLGFLHWLQTEAPRDDGGNGYPELMLRSDILGTKDGLSKFPYIRESRRIHPIMRIVEEDIIAGSSNLPRSTQFVDSVGIGLYPVDIHGEQEVPGAAQETSPFQIPLAALIPVDATNLLPACKNIGCTHITNGAYRLHPIEWAIGEAQGTLAALVVKEKQEPKAFLKDYKRLRRLQMLLVENGAPVHWFDDVEPGQDHFAAIQFLAITNILPGREEELHFFPNKPITEEEAYRAVSKVFTTANLLEPGESNTATKKWTQKLGEKHNIFKDLPGKDNDEVTRANFAKALYTFIKSTQG
ncbi:MAG TPA: FAD-dependent oxidoreductase [Drouetiella sp.]